MIQLKESEIQKLSAITELTPMQIQKLLTMGQIDTECAKRLFNSISTNTTRYGVVDRCDRLYDIINGID